MKEHIKRVDRILKYKGSILDIYTDVIETPDGHMAEWDYIDHRGAAAVVPVLDDGRLLMVRQYRDALDRETIEIPAVVLMAGMSRQLMRQQENLKKRPDIGQIILLSLYQLLLRLRSAMKW